MIPESQIDRDNQAQPAFIRVSKLHSIKTRMLVFALIATIIPSVTLGSLAYIQITRFLNQRISQNLRNVTAQVSKELDLSIKERIYDIRIFSSSYIITENLSIIAKGDSGAAERLAAFQMMSAYLQSIGNKFTAYSELMISDLDGRIVSSSHGVTPPPELPAKWPRLVAGHRSMISNVFFDGVHNERVMVISEPIRNAEDSVVGLMCAKLSVASIETTLIAHTTVDTDAIYLVNDAGQRITGGNPPAGQDADSMDHATMSKLIANPSEPATYRGYRNRLVIGTMATIPSLNLRVVVETDKAKAFRRVSSLQRLTMLLTGGIILFIGVCAYMLALTIVQPLKRLREGADQVASGNLNVALPVRNRSEVGYLTQVFNGMVRKLRNGLDELDRVNAILREKNQDLHQISITDPLTGLYNRKQLMEVLNSELARSVRHDYSFGLLIIDIDHFKSINDTFGHQKGDEVLCRLAATFQANIRKCDYAARYGGEEFILLLTETSGQGAEEVAERIRRTAEEDRVPSADGPIRYTVSVGIGTFPEDGNDAKALVEQADKALYKAKKAGRNQIQRVERP
jgi:diguanylate cyclase (GGDEF)-like protein